MNEILNQHIDMLVSSLKSPVLNDQDVTDLFELLLKQVGHFQARAIAPAMIAFSNQRPALYADLVRKRLTANKDSAVALLLRQLDDPDVPDETIDRSIRSAVDETAKNLTATELALVLPLVHDLRREVMVGTTLEMYLEKFEQGLDALGKKYGSPDFNLGFND